MSSNEDRIKLKWKRNRSESSLSNDVATAYVKAIETAEKIDVKARRKKIETLHFVSPPLYIRGNDE
jgi:hypothetical protein